METCWSESGNPKGDSTTLTQISYRKSEGTLECAVQEGVSVLQQEKSWSRLTWL